MTSRGDEVRECRTPDEALFAFVDGDAGYEGLDAHVAACDHCQAFLADLWIGELKRDLSEPVMRTLRFDEFLRAVLEVGFGIAARYGKAALEYTIDADE